MTYELESVSDDELVERLSKLVGRSRRVESELVAHIGEVDRRRLYAREACPSMFAYCTEILHLSEHEAYTRIAAARAARRHPVLLDMLGDGRLHLSGVARLASHLTEENCESVLARATHKSKRQIEELIAGLAPEPDVPASIRKLPDRRAKPSPARAVAQLVPERVTNLPNSETRPEPARERPVAVAANPVLPPPQPRSKIQPLSPARFKVEFTASAELNDKLQRLRALMRSSIPDGGLAAVIEDAVTEKLERLESRRYAETRRPRKTVEESDTTGRTRHIPAAVKRAVRRRDGNRCTYRDGEGRRCTERHRLEFHHHDPYGYGGDHGVGNVSLRCRAHNLLQAERDYGTEAMERYRPSTGIVREPRPVVYFEPFRPAVFQDRARL